MVGVGEKVSMRDGGISWRSTRSGEVRDTGSRCRQCTSQAAGSRQQHDREPGSRCRQQAAGSRQRCQFHIAMHSSNCLHSLPACGVGQGVAARGAANATLFKQAHSTVAVDVMWAALPSVRGVRVRSATVELVCVRLGERIGRVIMLG